ncbi:pyridoxal-phosphate dependent enzyme [Roseobacter sp. A03A-229]
MKALVNPYRRSGLAHPELDGVPMPSVDAGAPVSMLTKCPRAARTPLIAATSLAENLGVARVDIKDERGRMGLGSFKALGAAYVIACDHAEGAAKGTTYVTASAGNHGMSVAAGAAAFGAKSVIFIAETVPEAFAARLEAEGAEVIRAGAEYEASMAAAATYAEAQDAVLLSDSSWSGYTARPHRLMEGYLALMAEVFDQIAAVPTHVLLQAGVGGLAGACAAAARQRWGDDPQIIVVEPEVAPALMGSIAAGRPVETPGPVSAMGRLDCKVPSLIALKGLARDADVFATISEAEGQAGADLAAKIGLASTPSGAAGLAALMAGATDLALPRDASVLLILSEGPEV